MDSQSLPQAQLDILQYLYRFRFLKSSQLQRLLNHNNIRLTNYHLKHLIIHNYIGTHYSRSLGLANLPAVYYLSSGSIKVLLNSPDFDKRALTRVYREKIRSQQFITHTSFVAEYFLYLRGESQKTKHTLHFFTKTDLLAHPYIIHPLPDAYFVRVDDKAETKRYVVEVIDESAPRFTIRKRIEQYTDYIDSKTFEETTKHQFPTVLFICPTLGVHIYLKKYLINMYEESSLDQVSIFLTTREGAFLGEWEKVEAEEE